LPLRVAAPAARYPFAFEGASWPFGAVSMGNPHAVFDVPDVETAPVGQLAELRGGGQQRPLAGVKQHKIVAQPLHFGELKQHRCGLYLREKRGADGTKEAR